MRSDDSAVAGFFEDIPVLIIVMAGVCSLVLSGVLATERMAYREIQEDLDELADRLVRWVAINAQPDPIVEYSSISAFISLNISRCADEILDHESYLVSMVQRYPSVEWLRVISDSGATPSSSRGYSSALFNVRLSDGMIGIVEVTAFVWR